MNDHMTPRLQASHDELAPCLRAACETFSLYDTGHEELDESQGMSTLDFDQVQALWSRCFGQNFPLDALGDFNACVVSALNEHGRTTCAIWDLAHSFDHLQFELAVRSMTQH